MSIDAIKTIDGYHREIVKKLEKYYKSSRTRCLILHSDEKEYLLDLCSVLQPFSVEERFDSLWKSTSLEVVEEEKNLNQSKDMYTILTDSTYEIGKKSVNIVASQSQPSIQSHIISGAHSIRRYRCESKGISVVRRMGSALEGSELGDEIIRNEIEFHPETPFHTTYDLISSLIGTGAEPFRNPVVELVFPFWSTIKRIHVQPDSIDVSYELPQNMYNDLNSMLNIEMSDGGLLKKKMELSIEEKKLPNEMLMCKAHYSSEDIPLRSEKVRVSLAVDKQFALDWKTIDFAPSSLDLWNLLLKLEIGGQDISNYIFDIDKRKTISFDKFEYGFALLLSSFCFRVVPLGPLKWRGLDLLAISSDDTILVVECGRGKVEEKAAASREAVERLRSELKGQKIIGLAANSASVPEEVRRNLSHLGIIILDIDDIKELHKIVKQRSTEEAFIQFLENRRTYFSAF